MEESEGIRTGAESGAKIIIAFAIVIALVLVGTLYVLLSQSVAPYIDEPPVIDSWSIQNETAFPELMVNASDDHNMSRIDIGVYNATTGELKLERSYTPHNATPKIIDIIGLENWKEQWLRVKVNATDNKSQTSATVERVIWSGPPLWDIAPVIESWFIANNTKTPAVYINVSDADNNVQNLTIEICNSTGFSLLFWDYYVGAQSYNLIDQLNLTGLLPTGNYTVKVKAIDVLLKESVVLQRMISLP